MSPSPIIPSAAEVFSRLGLDAPPETWAQCWEVSQRELPEPVPFLTERCVTEACGRILLPADQREALVRALRFFDERPLWRRVFWHQHRLLFGDGRLPPDPLGYLPIPPDEGELSALYMALVFLSGIGNVFAAHAGRGIPEAVTAETLSDLGLRMTAFKSSHGYYGLREHRWTIHSFAGKLYRLGRLQYELQHFPCAMRAYRDGETGEVVVLAEPGVRFRADGQHASAAGGCPGEGWTSELVEGERSVRGTRISPRGRAVRGDVTLEVPRWRCVLRRGDPVLDMHIPVGGPLDFEACGESLRRAVGFFPRHFPEHRFAAFTCHAWFLDAQLEDCLAPSSNLVRFMREFHLLTVPMASDRGVLNRLFGGRRPDLDTAPQDTSLRRAAVACMRAGGMWYNGALFMFPEDLDWGAQVYRRGTYGAL